MTKNSYVAGQSALEQFHPVEQNRGVIQKTEQSIIQDNRSKNQSDLVRPESFNSAVKEDESAVKDSRWVIMIIERSKSSIGKIKNFQNRWLKKRDYFYYKEQRHSELEDEKRRSWPDLYIPRDYTNR
ncbi:hypothetical protein KJ966_08065 [bacterium]|nr:hypothetical protein [bacterium]